MNTNTIARKVRDNTRPILPPEPAVAVLSRVILGNRGERLLDATQGDVPAVIKGATVTPVPNARPTILGGVLQVPGAIGLGSKQTGLVTTSGMTSQSLALPIGSNYGLSEFATVAAATFAGLFNGTGATATATQSGGVIQSAVTITAGGSGYINGAAVAFAGSGGGSGATGTVTVVSGVVTAVTVTAGGTSYSGTITAIITPSTMATGSGAVYGVLNGGANELSLVGGSGDTFDGGAANGAVSIQPGRLRLFVDTAAGQWASVGPAELKLINSQTGTTYTLAASDNGLVVQITNASGITLTLPNSFPAGFECTVIQSGAGQITCSAQSGGSLVGWKTAGAATGATKTAGEYAAVTLRVLSNAGAAAVWNISGQTA